MKKGDIIKRELERRSNDEILIYNPTEEDYTIRFGGYTHIVPSRDKDVGYGKGQLVVARYLANHYVRHMIDALIMKESDAKVAKAKKEYKGGHWPEEEQKIALRTSNQELRKKYLKGLWKGVHRKFGVGEIADSPADQPKDRRPIDEQLIEELEDKPVEEKEDDFAEKIK